MSILSALVINFYSPEIPENKKSIVENNYLQIGFPFQYFEGEILGEEEVHYRVRLTYLYFMFVVFSLSPSADLAVVTPALIRPPMHVERLEVNKPSSHCKNFLKVAPTFMENSDKIVLTDKQIQQFDVLGQQIICGSITMEEAEAILKIRGGGGMTDTATAIAFILFVNWLESLYGVKAFQANPLPHMDPVGWMNGKYDQKPIPRVSYKSSQFQLEMAGVTDQMSPGPEMADEEGFIMSYEEAHNLVAEAYPGYLEIDEDCKITE